MRHPFFRFPALLLAALAVVLTACHYRGGHDNPAVLEFSIYSFLNGDDIRAHCQPGSPDRTRFVYNGIYIEQFRIYDVDTAGGGPNMKVQVREDANLTQLAIGTPRDVFDPWRGKVTAVRLRQTDWQQLLGTMRSAGVFNGAPRGLEMMGEDFFWIVNACVGGQFHFAAYKWPSPAFDRAAFAKLLLAWDPTGVPVNPPRKTSFFELYGAGEGSPELDQARNSFDLRVGDNGLVGVSRLF